MSETNVSKLPIPKLKAMAKKLGVDSKQPLAKLRKAVKAALAEAEAPVTEEKAAAKKPAARRGKASAAPEVDLSEILSRLDALEAKVADIEGFLGEDPEEEDEESEDEVEFEADGEDEDEESEDEPEEEDEAEEDDGDEIPDTIKPYMEDDGEGGYRLILDPSDIDEMDTDTLKDVLTVLGVDFGRTRSPRKLQAILREELENTASEVEEDDEDEDDAELEPGMRVAYTDADDDVYAAVIADPDEHGEADEDGEIRIIELLDDDSDEEPWVMDVSPDALATLPE